MARTPSSPEGAAVRVAADADADGVANASTRTETAPISAALTVLDRLPLSASGKVDRRALPAPVNEPESTGGAPRTEVEKAIADIWSEVLGVSGVGVGDEFFDIGGHSLLATRVLVRLRDLFGLDVPLRLLFEATTVGALAVALEHLAVDVAGATAPAGARPSP